MTASVTPVQMAVFAACVAHTRGSYQPITAEVWWRAPRPFLGNKDTFRGHLRTLDEKGLLRRRSGREARYDLAMSGERLAEFVGVPA